MRTDRFTIAVAADRATVWRALTDPCRTAAYFFGLRVESTWEPGAAVTFAGAGPESLTGSVLLCDPPHRLGYGVGARIAEDPDAAGDDGLSWVSWELEESGPGLTQVTLLHDQIGAAGPDTDRAWQQLLRNLETYLDSDRPLTRRTPRMS